MGEVEMEDKSQLFDLYYDIYLANIVHFGFFELLYTKYQTDCGIQSYDAFVRLKCNRDIQFNDSLGFIHKGYKIILNPEDIYTCSPDKLVCQFLLLRYVVEDGTQGNVFQVNLRTVMP